MNNEQKEMLSKLEREFQKSKLSESEIDPDTRSKLAVMRRSVLDQAESNIEAQTHKKWLNWSIPAAAVASIAVMFFVVKVPNQSGQSLIAFDVTELPVIMASDDIEFYQDLEFYEWLEQETN